MQQFLSKLCSKAEKNKGLLLLFIASTAFYVWQAATFWSWDFSVYLLNAQHFFSRGFFLELGRPPLASAILGLLHFLSGWQGVRFAYVIFVSALFCFSAAKLADSFKLNRTLFYALELSPFVLVFGTYVGTELLSLALLQIGLAYLLKPQSGLAISLASLARYTNLIYVPVIFLKKKRLLQRVFLYALPISMWLAINYFIYGSPWASIADSYLLNIAQRPFHFGTFAKDLLIAIGWYAPLAVLGIKRLKKSDWKINWLVAIFAFLTLISYLRLPHKEARYLFNLVMPFAFLATLAFKKFNRKVVAGIFIASLAIASLFSFTPASALNRYQEISKELNCACASNHWILFNSIGLPCEPAPRSEIFEKYIQEGYRIIIFENGERPQYNYTRELELAKHSNYIILGNDSLCKPPLKQMNKTHLQELQEIGLEKGYCQILFNKLC